MSVITRGAKNAFRNPARTVSVTVILAISIGLALVMLLSMRAVEDRITNVKSSIGNTVTVSPAGARGFDGGGEPLHQADADKVKALPNVASTYVSLDGRLQPDTDTPLQSAVDAGTLGARRNRTGREGATDATGTTGTDAAGGQGAPAGGTFKIPITVVGTSDASNILALGAAGTTLKSGTMIDASSSKDVAMVGTTLAAKNSLSVGSTFTAYGVTFTVSGIYDAGNAFSNNSIYIPIATLRTVADQADEVSSITVQASSIDTLSSVEDSIKTALGSAADVTSSQDSSANAIAPLENIKTISLYSLFGSLVAGSIITFLIMMMVVRERRKEIGVLKAIGASNFTIVVQFVSESLVLTLAGSIVGTILGALLSNPILNALVSSNTTTTTTATGGFGGGPGGGGFPQGGGAALRTGFRNALPGASTALKDLQATVGIDILLYGLLAALVIAVLGSSIPAWLIAKVRPAEVMRGE